jgi:hypothetical protein
MNELSKTDHQVSTLNPETLIAKAIESQVPVESLERLLAMRQQIRQEQAREAYFRSLAEFQSECPSIEKSKKVRDRSGGVRYAYAPLDDIIRQVGPLLVKHGFSYSIQTDPVDDGIRATCTSHHEAGHSESSHFDVPVEKEAFMNDAQKMASAQTYAKRYAFTNVFGLMTTDQDDDAAAMGGSIKLTDIYKRNADHTRALIHNFTSVMDIKKYISDNNISAAVEAFDEIPRDDQIALWLAPTKGGCFTTAERDALKYAKQEDAT